MKKEIGWEWMEKAVSFAGVEMFLRFQAIVF